MKQIILDTNFLLVPFTLKIDIFTEIERIIHEPYEICIINKTIDELNSIIENQKGKHKESAGLALQLIKKKNIVILEPKHLNMTVDSKSPIVDDIILKIANENTYVATQDKILKNKLKQKGIKVIYSRNKKLEIKDVL